MASRKRTAHAETIVYKGIEFRRYPDAQNWSDRVYYRPGGSDASHGVEALHREIWKDQHGPIPQGWHIHHRDSDPLNNEPSNLVCLPGPAHQAEHGDRTKSATYKARRRTVLDTVREKARAWHGTEAGLAWHAAHGRATWTDREPVAKTCVVCGEVFQAYFDRARYCSPRCKERARPPRKQNP